MSMILLKPHLALLGKKVEDKITGFKGVVTTVCFDLYGCIQAAVSPGMKPDKSGLGEALWFDVGRLTVKSDTPVMAVPSFDWSGPAVAQGQKGPAAKPSAGY